MQIKQFNHNFVKTGFCEFEDHAGNKRELDVYECNKCDGFFEKNLEKELKNEIVKSESI